MNLNIFQILKSDIIIQKVLFPTMYNLFMLLQPFSEKGVCVCVCGGGGGGGEGGDINVTEIEPCL